MTGEDGAPQRQNGLILLVEDEPHIAFAVQMCLEQAGYRVETAADGVEGLDKAFSSRPALVLLDLLLPKLAGHLVLKALREDVRTRDIPVVVLSAVAKEAEKSVAFAEGAQDYLVKPFSPRDLTSTVRRYLSG